MQQNASTAKTFSVLTVSKRTGWEELAANSIDRQTIQPKSWIVIHENPGLLHASVFERWHENVWKAPERLRASNLNASLNEGLRKITTDYVIFYQDFIELPTDCFEKLLDLADPNTLVTTCTPNYDGTDDSRYTGLNEPRRCIPREWEANVAIAPMNVIQALGGFEEELDNGWSWDNVNLAERATILGCHFILDESNRPRLLPHEQTSKLELEPNANRHARIMYEIKEGQRPLRCNYL